MTLREAPLLIGVVSNLVPILAAWFRRRSRLQAIATLLAGLAVSFHLLVLFQLVHAGSAIAPNPWVHALMASAMPVLLAGYLLSVSIGRDRPEEALRGSRRTFVYMGLFGIVFLFLLRKPAFVTGYEWSGEMGTIHLGWLGKAYLSFLLVGIVVVGYKLESTYRLVPSNVRHRLRLPFLGFFGILGFYIFVLTTGILYSALGLGKLIASGVPIAIANTFLAYGFLRGALTDVSAPVSRNFVYSSFTALAAGLYVLAVGVVAELATFTHWSPDEVVTLSFGFLAVLVAILLLFSNRFQRQMRRFIDKNFYVNRYDYRTQWSNVTQALDSALERADVLRCAVSILEDVFLADEVTVALRGQASLTIRPCMGKGAKEGQAALEEGSPLFERLRHERRSHLFDHKPDDFEYIPIYAENRPWLDATASQLVAPLVDGADLIGTLGLERHSKDDPFTFEDVALLDSVAAHLSAALRSVRLAEELAESREMDLLSQWSNMLLHDLKNYLSPLRMVAQNLVKFRERPSVAEIAAKDIDRVADRMEALVQSLSQLRENSRLTMRTLDVNELVRASLEELQVSSRSSLEVKLELQAGLHVAADEAMLKRVLENLVTNAVEAMNDCGRLSIRTCDRSTGENGRSSVQVSVTDTGPGIPEEFLRDRLFRPFATTKKGGLGLGLYQCRCIVRAHGGELRVESELGRGTTFHLILASAHSGAAHEEIPKPQNVPNGVMT
jgi:hypothetical protein